MNDSEMLAHCDSHSSPRRDCERCTARHNAETQRRGVEYRLERCLSDVMSDGGCDRGTALRLMIAESPEIARAVPYATARDVEEWARAAIAKEDVVKR